MTAALAAVAALTVLAPIPTEAGPAATVTDSPLCPVDVPELVWAPLVCGTFEADDWGWVLCVIDRESRGNPNAQSPTDDWGLMQLNGLWVPALAPSRRALLDPVTNLDAARELLDLRGGSPRDWIVHTGAYDPCAIAS